jgi:MFS family permease
MTAIIGTFAFNFPVVFPLFVKENLGGTDTTFTILYAVVAIGSLVAALTMARRTSISVHDVIRGAVLFGVSLMVMAVSPSIATTVGAALFTGFASIVVITTTTAMVQLSTAPVMRGRVLALQAMVLLGSTPIGGPILGWVCEEFGARIGFVVGAAACFVAAAWGVAAARRAAANAAHGSVQALPVSAASQPARR